MTSVGPWRDVIERMRGGIVVSVQVPVGSPFRGPQFAAALARAAETGGASGVRADSPADVAATAAAVRLPVMGIYTLVAPGTPRQITPTLDSAAAIARAGAAVIAVDGTGWPNEMGAVATLIRAIHEELDLPVQADVATLVDGIAARAAGADLVGSAIAGYQPGTAGGKPDIELVRALVLNLDCPVVAERYYVHPAQIRAAFDAGAFAVVVGSAITDVAAATRRLVVLEHAQGRRSEGEATP